MPIALYCNNKTMNSPNSKDLKYNTIKSVIHVRPKRPKSAYVLYMESLKNDFFLESPETSFNDFQKQTGDLWRNMSEEEKRPWNEYAMVQKSQYLEEIKQLHSYLGISDEKPADKIAPQRMKIYESPFGLYVNEMRGKLAQEFPGLSYNLIQKKLSGNWKEMSSDEKEEWRKKMHETNSKAIGEKRPKGKHSSRFPAISELKAPRSAYSIFFKLARPQILKQYPGASFNEYPTLCANLWKDLPENEKTPYLEAAAHDRERYNQELANIISSEGSSLTCSSEPTDSRDVVEVSPDEPEPSTEGIRPLKRKMALSHNDVTAGDKDESFQESKSLKKIKSSCNDWKEHYFSFSDEDIGLLLDDLADEEDLLAHLPQLQTGNDAAPTSAKIDDRDDAGKTASCVDGSVHEVSFSAFSTMLSINDIDEQLLPLTRLYNQQQQAELISKEDGC